MNYDPELNDILQGMRHVARGLRWIYAGYVTRSAAFVITILLSGIFNGQPLILGVVTGAFILVLIVGTLMGLFGRAKCRNVPEGSKAHPYIWAAVLLDLVGILVLFAPATVGMPGELAAAVHLVVFMAGMVCFMIFLRYTAELIQSQPLAERARSILQNALWIALWMAIISIVTFVLTRKGGQGVLVLFACSFLIASVLLLILLFQFTNLLRRLGDQIDRVIDHTERRLSIRE